MIFIESRAFSHRLTQLGKEGSDAVFNSIQKDLAANPERGDVVQGLGGIRKARAADPGRGKGKRSGFRYLYLYVVKKDHIHLLYLFGKDEQEDLSKDERKELRALAVAVKGQD